MPELPEVEVLVRHLRPLLIGRRIESVVVHRAKVIRPSTERAFRRTLRGARFAGLERRGKYLIFDLHPDRSGDRFQLLGHLGMTGRMYLQENQQPLPKHVAVTLGLDRRVFIFEDLRYFGRLSLDLSAVQALGPEPLGNSFSARWLRQQLASIRSPIKPVLLDQQLIAGIGNIYANEALYAARISPLARSCDLSPDEVGRLCRALRRTLAAAIRFGSTVPLALDGQGRQDGLFYYGRRSDVPTDCEERLLVYDRAAEPCRRCKGTILRVTQGGRGTFYCPVCQRGGAGKVWQEQAARGRMAS